MRRTIRRNLGVTIALLSSLPLAARADDSSDLEGLLSETVVTGASRTAETASDAPAVSTTISAKDFKRYGMRTIDEAINFLGLGLSVNTEWQFGQYTANGVGFQDDFSRHILFIIDGVTQNEQFLGAMMTGSMMGLPLDMIDHIEVILGPGSVLYGSQAMLGVVNIVTKSASDYKGVHVVVDTGLSPGLNAQDNMIAPKASNVGLSTRIDATGAATFKLFGKESGLTGGLEYFDDNGPQTAYALQSNILGLPHYPQNFGPADPPGVWGGTNNLTNYRHTVGGYVKWNIGEVTATARLFSAHWAVPFYDFLYKGGFNDPGSSSRFVQGLTDLRWEHAFSQTVSTLMRAYTGFSTYDRTDDRFYATGFASECPAGPAQTCVEHFGGNSAWVGTELQGNVDWLGDDREVTMVGLDARLRSASGGTYMNDYLSGKSYGALGYANKFQDALGLYAQHRAKFNDFFSANVGVRADFDTVNPDPSLFSGISPRIALVESVDHTFNIKEVFSSAFRSPSAAELYDQSDTLLPPKSLAPERVKQGSLILDKRFGQQHFMLAGFYALWENMIAVAVINGGNNLQFQNTAKIENYGLNFAFDGAALEQRLRFALNFTAARAVRLDLPSGPETSPTAPGVYGNARLSYDLLNEFPVLALVAQGMGPRLADNAYIGGYVSNLSPRPVAPSNVDLRATVSGPVPSLKGVSYRLGGDYFVGKWLPYVVGPTSGAPDIPGQPQFQQQTPALAPANRMTIFATLQMDVSP